MEDCVSAQWTVSEVADGDATGGSIRRIGLQLFGSFSASIVKYRTGNVAAKWITLLKLRSASKPLIFYTIN
jgi:hypothetical protein